MRVTDAVRETRADVLSASPSSEQMLRAKFKDQFTLYVNMHPFLLMSQSCV